MTYNLYIYMKIINLICHRNPNRSFFIKGHQFPVCIRCTGCYLAISLYLIYTYYFYVDYTIYLIITAILLLIPMAIDGTTQLLTNRIVIIHYDSLQDFRWIRFMYHN